MIRILMASTKLATLDLLKIEVFWNKVDDVIVSVHDVNNKILSHDSNYTVDVVMWPKFGNSSISMKHIIISSILWGFHHKNQSMERCSWSKFNNLELAIGMAVKFYTSVEKGLKVKVKKKLGSNSCYCRNCKEKTGRRTF